MSALTHSPGFFDFLKPLVSQLAPILPGPYGTIARGVGSVLGGAALGTVATEVATDLLIRRPSESVTSTAPTYSLPDEDGDFVEEEVVEETPFEEE